MAGDWIKVRWNIATDPDVVLIAAATGLDEFGVVGRLHAVWSWADQHSEDGTNVRISSAFLDRLTACPGFAEAMRTVGWLTGRDGSITFPAFAVHNGETAKLRASETKRKQSQRERDKCPANTGTNVPQQAGPEKRREEKDRKIVAREDGGEESDTPPPAEQTPTLAEVLAAAKLAGIPNDHATQFFNACEARPFAPSGGWTARDGQPMNMERWRNAMAAYSASMARSAAARPAGAGGAKRAAKPSKWDDEF